MEIKPANLMKEEMGMKRAACLLIALLLGLVISFSSCAPARPPKPGPNYVWVNGHYGPGGNWIPGHWKHVGSAPPGKVWVPGHYGPNGRWIPGHWR